jgi:ABC-type multidrug transport system ATPase subunit/pSer/pThr/pTyr-binding forkhead associated (FHA) protein
MYLIFKNDEKILSEKALSDYLSISIGRNPEKSDVVFINSSVSSLHAQIIFKNSKILLQDLGSKNGTFVNGKLIEANTPILLIENDVVRFGNLGFSELHIKAYKSITQTQSTENDKLKKLRLIGRADECEIKIDDITVSRKHASLTQLDHNTFLLKDLNSTNGVYFKGEKITEVQITKNDYFIVGKHIVFADGKVERLENKIAIQVQNLSKVFNKNNTALHPLSFEIKPKTFTAIMGPSGCGKSTLLKSLINQLALSTGEIKLFGLNLKSDFSYLKKQIGYVPQDDIIHLELTVYQSIFFAAQLRLEHYSKTEIENRVNYLIKVLHLENIKDNFNHSISGGQRKRVCIAIELLSNPLILFLDEPTSPLDPQSIEEFLTILNKLKNEGTTIVMVTHKPEDLAFVDDVLFLAEKGHLVFHGKTSEYLNFFNVETTTEVYAELSVTKALKWIGKQHTNNFAERVISTENNFKKEKIAWFNQFLILTKRNIKIKLNDKLNTAILIFQAPIIALLIALIFDEISVGVLFMMCISAIWFGVNNASREIVKEKNIYEREHNFNVKISSYLASKILTLISLAALQSVLFVSVLMIRYSSAFVQFDNFIQLVFYFVLITTVASLMGLLVSATMKNTEKVMSLIPILLIPQIMLTGVISKINNVFVEVLSYFTISRWSLDGLATMQEKVAVLKPKLVLDANKIPLKDELGNVVFENIKVKETAIKLVNENYHSSFEALFNKSTFILDFSALLLFSFIMILSLFFVMKHKDLKNQ